MAKNSVPLSEAPIKFGDPTLVAEYLDLKAKGYDREYVFGGAAGSDSPKVRRCGELLNQLRDELIAKLVKGSLAASGYAALSSSRENISADLWQTLVPEWRLNRARCSGLEIGDIVVFESTSAATKKDRSPDSSRQSRASLKDVQKFIKKYVDEEKAARRTPTQVGLENAARKAGVKATRDQLRRGLPAPGLGRPKKT